MSSEPIISYFDTANAHTSAQYYPEIAAKSNIRLLF